MNNLVLDVAIGLILIFVLYSLLATTISELIASIFSYRQRMLDISLEQMLDGKNISYYWWDKLINIVIWLFYFIKDLGFYLFQYFKIFIKRNNPPMSNGKMKIAQLKFAKTRKKNLFLQKGNKKYKFRRKLNSKAILFAAKITTHPLYLRSSENSWLNKKPAYLSASVFSDILLDILKSDPKGIGMMKNIKKEIDTNHIINTETKKILNIYLEQANGDLQRFKLLIENWYDETQKRVSGWYKRKNYWILLLIGFSLATIFNVSTIDIVKKLSNNPTLSASIADNATELVKNKQLINDTQLQKNAEESLKKINTLRNDYIDSANTLLGMGWNFPQNDTIIQLGIFNISYSPENNYCKAEYIVVQTLTNSRLWLGFLLTAFAISLGAPFWFDLLNKFVNLRISGKKPNETTSPLSSDNKTDSLNKKPDPTAKG